MTNMSTDGALMRVRGLAANAERHLVKLGEIDQAAIALAGAVIAMRQAETDVAAAWGQHRDNPHIPDELRRALDALTEKRTS